MTAKQAILDAYGKEPNFMTPDIMEYGKAGPEHYYELSKGRGIFTDTIFGVTIVTVDGQRAENLSRGGFYTEAEARDYIEELCGV